MVEWICVSGEYFGGRSGVKWIWWFMDMGVYGYMNVDM